jgi:O-antigen/teichoic acid export membrane protein
VAKGLFIPVKILSSRLYTNTAYLWSGELSWSLLGFVFWAVVARWYSPEAVGLAGTIITSIVLLAQGAQLGLGYVLIRLIPQGEEGAPALLGRSLVAVMLASLVVGLIFLGTLPLWSKDLRDLLWQGPGSAVLYLVFVGLVAESNLLRFIFVAYRRGVYVLAQRIIVGVLRIPLAILLGGLGSAFGIVAGHGLATLAGILLVGLLPLPQYTGRLRISLALDVWRLAPVAPMALSNLASHVLTVLAWQLLPLPVIALAGAEEAGFFYIAWAVAGLVLVMSQQLSLSLFAEGSYAMQRFGSQAQGALLLGVALGGLFAVMVYFVGDSILLLFGREYVVQSGGVLKLLAAATPLAAVANTYLSVERVRGRLAPLVAVSAVVMVVMVGATVLLVPRLGIEGAGYAVVAGYGVGALLGLCLLYPMMRRGQQTMGNGQSRVA